MKINAYAAKHAKDILKPFSYDSKPLSEFDVLVKITHCGVCHTDLHFLDNDMGITPYPFVPGHEVVGTVEETGKSVKNLKKGQRVGIGWQIGACLECEYCESGQENLCANSKATCVGNYGGFADYITVDNRFAFAIPEEIESENAGPLLCGGITVYSPFKLYNVKPNHKVGIIGIGGLGHFAVQFAASMGCEVTAFSTSPDKEEEAHNLGADKFVNSKDAAQMQKTAGKFDYIISTVSGDADWMQYFNALKPNGRLNFAGISLNNVSVPISGLVLGQKSLSGSVTGGRAMIREMLEFAARHDIKAMTEVMPVSQVNAAIDKVRKNQARYRMVLKMD